MFSRLNIYLNDHDTAVDTFEKIINRFAPIRNELDKFTRDPKNIQRYFQWLIERRGEGGDLNAPMTPRAAAWVESAGEMKRMAGIFEELGEQSRELLSTQDMAQMLEATIESRSRVELFPELKDGWAQALIVENKLLQLASELLEYQYEQTRDRLSGEERAKLEALRRWRRAMEVRFRKLPMTFEQYKERKARVDESFLDLQRDTFVVSQRLKELEREIVAVEQYVNEKQFGVGGDRYSEDQEHFETQDQQEARPQPSAQMPPQVTEEQKTNVAAEAAANENEEDEYEDDYEQADPNEVQQQQQ